MRMCTWGKIRSDVVLFSRFNNFPYIEFELFYKCTKFVLFPLSCYVMSVKKILLLWQNNFLFILISAISYWFTVSASKPLFNRCPNCIFPVQIQSKGEFLTKLYKQSLETWNLFLAFTLIVKNHRISPTQKDD